MLTKGTTSYTPPYFLLQMLCRHGCPRLCVPVRPASSAQPLVVPPSPVSWKPLRLLVPSISIWTCLNYMHLKNKAVLHFLAPSRFCSPFMAKLPKSVVYNCHPHRLTFHMLGSLPDSEDYLQSLSHLSSFIHSINFHWPLTIGQTHLSIGDITVNRSDTNPVPMEVIQADKHTGIYSIRTYSALHIQAMENGKSG